MAAGKVFLNYRREDAQHPAGRLHDRLEARFGPENVVFDIDSIPLGADFVAYLNEQVASCEVLLAMIGPRWLEALQARERRGEPDFVRIEIEAALARDILVVPVLVDAAAMPREADLPEPLRPLARRNAARLTHERFRSDADGLLDGLERAQAHTAREGVETTALTPATPAPASPRPAPKPSFPVPEMIRIEPGDFLMGSDPRKEDASEWEQPKHRVRIDYPFEIGKVAVIFDEFDAFCEETDRAKPGDKGWGRGRRPVINVSAEDAEAYCAWLNGAVGPGFRLPSEAEWEYCCRAGTQTRWSFGDDERGLDAHAWFGGNSGRKTHPVGEKRANDFGLRDMHGNVWEWCADCWNESYAGAPTDGSAWRSEDCSKAVLRGGSWNLNLRDLRSASRYRTRRDFRGNATGFRVARTLTR